MASSGKSNRPKRFCAIEAHKLLNEWLDDSDASDCEPLYESESDSDSDRSSASDKEEGETESRENLDLVDYDNPIPGPSHAPTGRGRGRPLGGNKSRPRSNVVEEKWTLIPRSNQEIEETQNNFRFAPSAKSGVQANLTPQSTPLDCYSTLLSDDLIEDLVEAINDFARLKVALNTPARKRSVYGSWKEVTKHEILRYFSILLAIGMDKRSKYPDYWSEKKHRKTPWYSEMLVRDRFEAINSTMLHCCEPQAVSKSKIEPFVNKLLKNFQTAFYPFQDLAIDEMIIGWKGRFKYKTFNAAKPKKYHVKTFGLCDSTTGYVVNLLIYFGAETSYDPELDVNSESAIKVFQTLLQPIDRGHHIFADRFYTTYNLVKFLKDNSFYYTGTVQTNRRNFPKELKTLKLEKQESKFFMNEDKTVVVVSWRDKKAAKSVTAVSTKGDTSVIHQINKRREQVSKPTIIDSYNWSMNGCDKMDQLVSYYGMYQRKTRKWWKKLFHWILEISQANAYILYRLTRGEDEKYVSFRNFKDSLIDELILKAIELRGPEDEQAKRPVGRPATVNPIVRFSGNMHLVKYVEKDNRCVVCSTPEKRKRTNFVCLGCPENPHLHPKDCFLKYHTELRK